MRMPQRWFVFVAILCGSASLASAQNLLRNGTFDSGISPWSVASSQTTVATFSSLDADGNAASGSVRATASFFGTSSGAGLLSECIPVVAGVTYQRSFDYLIEPASGVDVIVYAQINWFNDASCTVSGSGFGGYTGELADGAWHASPDPDDPNTAPEGARSARLALNISASVPGPMTAHFDNVVFKVLNDCGSLDDVLCLNQGRFQVAANWRTADASGRAHAVQLTSDTGYLWFFDPNNVEVVVKVLDACEPFGRFWVFAGGLTNVEVDLVVTDSMTGQTNTYHNNLNQPFAPLQDTDAFATCP